MLQIRHYIQLKDFIFPGDEILYKLEHLFTHLNIVAIYMCMLNVKHTKYILQKKVTSELDSG